MTQIERGQAVGLAIACLLVSNSSKQLGESSSLFRDAIRIREATAGL
jgi:hypothetical protein